MRDSVCEPVVLRNMKESVCEPVEVRNVKEGVCGSGEPGNMKGSVRECLGNLETCKRASATLVSRFEVSHYAHPARAAVPVNLESMGTIWWAWRIWRIWRNW